jgi:hypothetical protein
MTDLNTYSITRSINGVLETITVKANTRREAILMADDYAANARTSGGGR